MRNTAITPPPHICSDMHHCFPKEPPQSMFLTNSLSRQITYTSPGLMFCVRNEFKFFFCMRKLIVLLCPKWNYWQNNLAMAISTSSKSATTTLLHNNMSLDPIHNPTANMGWIFLFYGRKQLFNVFRIPQPALLLTNTQPRCALDNAVVLFVNFPSGTP